MYEVRDVVHDGVNQPSTAAYPRQRGSVPSRSEKARVLYSTYAFSKLVSARVNGIVCVLFVHGPMGRAGRRVDREGSAIGECGGGVCSDVVFGCCVRGVCSGSVFGECARGVSAVASQPSIKIVLSRLGR